MAYYYQNPNHNVYTYEYGDDGNHSNNEYKSYLNYMEPDHTTPEPNRHHTEHGNDAVYGDDRTDMEWTANRNGYELKEPVHDKDGMDWERGCEGEVEGYKLKELEHDEDKIAEHGEWKHESEYEERYKPKRLKYNGDKAHEHGELIYKPEHGTETNYVEHNMETSHAEHRPYRSEYDDEQAAPVTFNSTPATFHSAYRFIPTTDSPIAYHDPHHLTPTSIPPNPSFIHTPIPCMHNPPHLNQQGHMTTSKNPCVPTDFP